jgi:tRNA (cytosine49-C5)-methyltransferase
MENMILPALFLERLHKIVPAQYIHSVEEAFSQKKAACFRWNSLKGDSRELLDYLEANQISFARVPWYNLAFMMQTIESTVVSHWEMANQGKIYIQSLSSMLPAVVLDPQPGDMVLDLCAAPGSKTTQMAAAMQDQGRIVAVEAIRDRFYRLKSVVQLLGPSIIETKCLDGRRFRTAQGELFDRVLVDAPCSSEGRFKTYDKKSIGYWNLRKIREMVKKQRGLLLNACRLLKPGGVLVYSTCTFAPEENEGVVSWVLKKMQGEVSLAAIDTEGFERYPALSEWQEKAFDPQVVHCCRVLPTSTMEGFFMAKFIKR